MEEKTNGVNDSSARLKSLNTKIVHDENEDEVDDHSNELVELNNRIKNDFMSYCLSLLQDDEESRECTQIVWNKYLQCVGDVATISAFFDMLPYHVKLPVLQRYQNEIIDWCRNLFHIDCHTILYATDYTETFSRLIRCVLKQSTYKNNLPTKKAIIYVPIDFDTDLKADLSSSIPNIQFEHIPNDVIHEDMIDVNRLEQAVKRDLNHAQLYPFMVIANAGTALLGSCDELTKIKQLCQEHNVWLHVIGDLLGSLAPLSAVKENVNINCDSLTMDTVKLLGIQNLPYLTFFIRSMPEVTHEKQTELNSIQDERLNNDSLSTAGTNVSSSSSSTTATINNNSLPSHPFLDIILSSPSINFLSIWSISQRCSKSNVLYHMKCSFDLLDTLKKRLSQIKSIRILNEENDQQSSFTYKRICSGDAPDELMPRTVVLFRFETLDVPEIEKFDDLYGYIDLLNLWLFDKLSQQYPKLNFELLKSVHFQIIKSDDNHDSNRPVAHAIRFAPLEHLLDVIDEHEMSNFCDDIQRFSDILLATMTARARLSSTAAKYENLIAIPMPQWAGIGAIRYVPSQVDLNEQSEESSYDINTIQAELARKLQTNDSAFSLGGGVTEHGSMFYLRLGMIRKQDDLDVLLRKIAEGGKETETSLKYVEDMAEKIRVGIEKVQKDLQNENQQILAQEGLLRQLPVISNLMSWWSPAPSASPLATKGRSFDLNSGRVESTEDTYVYRMQIDRQSPHAPTHNEDEVISSLVNTDSAANSNDDIPEQKDNQ